MVCVGLRHFGFLPIILFCACPLLLAQHPEQLNTSGQITIAGHSTPYLIRHLPVSSFPGLPADLAAQLTRRGCLIPQTYQAHRPENVIHASLERAGSSDWAVLCSEQGTVSLLVYFSSDPTHLFTLAAAPETDYLQAHDLGAVFGFNWGIDPASPAQIHEAQSGLKPRPAPLDHDALADSLVDHKTIYHFYGKNAWTVLPTPK